MEPTSTPYFPRSERSPVNLSCSYEFIQPFEDQMVMYHRGDAASVNMSVGGMLLLMPHTPRLQQIFEVYAPASLTREEKKLSLVEVRWRRRISNDEGRSIFFVGVKFVLSPTASDRLRYLEQSL